MICGVFYVLSVIIKKKKKEEAWKQISLIIDPYE